MSNKRDVFLHQGDDAEDFAEDLQEPDEDGLEEDVDGFLGDPKHSDAIEGVVKDQLARAHLPDPPEGPRMAPPQAPLLPPKTPVYRDVPGGA